MSRRAERMSSVIREVVSDAIANRLSDPRISRFTSVTRVAMTADMEYADVAVSVMGTDREARRTMEGLSSARGAIQTMLAKRLDIRRCPLLRFELDVGIKKGFEIVQELDRLGAEREARERRSQEPGDATGTDPRGPER